MAVNVSTHEPIVDVLHGVRVADPYRWLEDRTSQPTRHWIEVEQQRHNNYFAQLPGIVELRARVSSFLDRETLGQPSMVGNRLFFCRRRKGEEQGSIYLRNTETGEERSLVDPSRFGPNACIAIHRISQDGGLMAYAVKRGGERTEELRFLDVSSGRTFDDHLERGYARGLAFASDETGFYYCHEQAAPIRENHLHEVRFHLFGAPFDQDEVLISLPRNKDSRLVLISDERNLGAVFVCDGSSDTKADLYLACRSNIRCWRRIPIDGMPSYTPFLHNGRIYLVSFSPEPNGEILDFDQDTGDISVIVPAWRESIEDLHLAEECLYLSYRVDNQTHIHRWTWDGKFLGVLPPHPEGSFRFLPSYSGSSDALFFAHESFSEPPSILIYRETTRSYTPWGMQAHGLPDRRYLIRRISYPSKDGTQIPMWIVEQEGGNTDVCRPTILTAYGGFGISMTPRFSVLVAVMLELGCVFALPNIRGGSEFRKAWHEAARRRNRQVAYDDFIAAAEWLCANRITESERLAIFGGSNSGLLVAAAMTQKPELFRAVLCISPILDMLRYETFGNANKWIDEYGSVTDAEDFRVLHSYSPYHHVRDDIDYPATLFVTGDKDAQCDPAHVRKMAARMQDRPAQRRPILVDYSAERGHSPVLPLSVRVDALTRRIGFLSNELGIGVPVGARQ
jgi:prolyl oligopeptidase